MRGAGEGNEGQKEQDVMMKDYAGDSGLVSDRLSGWICARQTVCEKIAFGLGLDFGCDTKEMGAFVWAGFGTLECLN